MEQQPTKPAIIMPLHDPNGLYLPHIWEILDDLQSLFSVAYVSITPHTRHEQTNHVERLLAEPFFHCLEYQQAIDAAEQFWNLYTFATSQVSPTTLLHICFPDRVSFALQSHHRTQFMHDVATVTIDETPLIFTRSETAWATHPQNYREIEMMATQCGEHLLNKPFDFAWCHLAMTAQTLQTILPQMKRQSFGEFFAEMILYAHNLYKTQAVDWLAWEDPFIFNQPAATLKTAREQSIAETHRRYNYVVPILQTIVRYSQMGAS